MLNQNEYIFSVAYNAKSGEYTIKRKNQITGKRSITTANHLTAEEINFVNSCRSVHEIGGKVFWTGGKTK